MAQTKLENSTIQLAASANIRKIWGDLIVNVKSYGAIGDSGTTDNTTKIQAAINYVQLNGGGKIVIPPGTYFCSDSLIINYGLGYDSVAIEGVSQSESVLVFNKSSGDFIVIKPNLLRTDPDALYGISFFSIKDLILSGLGGSSTGRAIKVGLANYVCDSFSWNVIDNVLIKSFGEGIYLDSCRHISMTNVVVRDCGQRALHIKCIGTNDFTGDFNFNYCEFTSGNDQCILIHNVSSAISGGIGGIHFNDCIIYGSSVATQTVYILSEGGGRIADTWFNSCALDQGNNIAFRFNIAGTSQIFRIMINNCYVVAFTSFITYTNTSTDMALKGQLNITDNMVANTNQPFIIGNCFDIIMEGNFFHDVTAKSIFDGNSKNITLVNNRFSGTLLAAHCVTITAAVQSAIIKNNFGNFGNAAAFLENLTLLGATRLVNADNLQIV